MPARAFRPAHHEPVKEKVNALPIAPSYTTFATDETLPGVLGNADGLLFEVGPDACLKIASCTMYDEPRVKYPDRPPAAALCRRWGNSGIRIHRAPIRVSFVTAAEVDQIQGKRPTCEPLDRGGFG
jgi:hypothetical protein